MKKKLLGYDIISSDTDAVLDDIFFKLLRNPASKKESTWLACINPHSYAVALDDLQFKIALQNSHWLIPDGIGIVLASKLLGIKITGRITGCDIFYGLHHRMNKFGGMSVFFMGSSEGNLINMKRRMAIDFPHIKIAGTYSPPYKTNYSQKELSHMIQKVNDASPDVLWIGMTAPKQEKWIYQNKDLLKVKFIGAVGAVFDFYTGKVTRSPIFFQRLGLEWLPRLLKQPGRLWRRVFFSGPIFLWHVCIFMLLKKLSKKC